MEAIDRRRALAVLAWGSAAAVMIVPVAVAVFSPYLASRTMPYIVGGFAGIIGLSFLFLQPLLPAGYLAGSAGPAGRRWHRWLGVAIIVAVALHVGGLYLASPPDTIDALLLVSPTPFSIYGAGEADGLPGILAEFPVACRWAGRGSSLQGNVGFGRSSSDIMAVKLSKVTA